MATTKTTTARGAKSGTTRAKAATSKATSAKTTAAKTTAAKSASRSAAKRPENDSLVARTGRTIKERPYTSAAIATGAVGVVAAAAAAGAFLVSRRDKSFKEASDELATKVKGGVASATGLVKEGVASATETVKELGQRGADYFKGEGSDSSGDTRSQREIAEEALSLKETGATTNPAEALQATEIKAGAISY